MSKHECKRLLLLIVGWFAGTQLILSVSQFFLPYQPSFPYTQQLDIYDVPDYLRKWAHFDGVHYLTIAQIGYAHVGLIQAFFPLYPLLIEIANYFMGNTLLSGLVLSHAFAVLGILSFYYLVKINYNQAIAWKTTVLFLCFVSSFYLRSVYSESLFLTLICLSLICAKKRWYVWAGVAAACASATRITGVLLYPSLLLLVWFQDRRKISAYLAVSLAPLGLLAYMQYLHRIFGDYFYFFHVQSEFGTSRQTSLVPLPQVIYRYLKILTTVKPIDWKYYAYVQEFLASMAALFVLLRWTLSHFFKKSAKENNHLLISLLFFTWGSYLLPPLTGNFSSMPRYLLLCFPLFIYLATLWNNKSRWQFFYLTISLILLIINIVLFAQGYWVA